MAEAGTIIGGHYRIVRKLGEGGRGSVYLAVNLRTERFWAAKEIVRGGPFPDEGQEYRKETAQLHEAEMMKSLSHPNLPQMIDVFPEQGSVWLIMEYVRGIRLDHYLRGSRTLPEKQALDTALQICEALCYLQRHSPPVFHLDIKPENLIRMRDGRIRLVDFGAAWKKDALQVNEGTDGYAAPEQYRKDAPKDARTDVYGLGAAVYRMVSGKKYDRRLSGSHVPGCGKAFSDVIGRCLMDIPEDRYQNADELRRALLRVRRQDTMRQAKTHVLSACAIALPAAALCVSILPSSLDLSEDAAWNYGRLLAEARCVPEEESRTYYRRAVFLEPGNPDAYLNYLRDAAADGCFSEKEETFLRNLLHTVPLNDDRTSEELLQQDASGYGRLSERIGMMYRYEYGGEDGPRIAAGWFEKACRTGEMLSASGTGGLTDGAEISGNPSESGAQPGWLTSARRQLLLSEMERGRETNFADGDRMETDQAETDGEDPGRRTEQLSETLRYWRLLSDMENDLYAEEDPVLKTRQIAEIAWQIVFRIPDLEEAGIEKKKIADTLSGMRDEAYKIRDSSDLRGSETAFRPVLEELEEAVRAGRERTAGMRREAGKEDI